jgi:putative transposase
MEWAHILAYITGTVDQELLLRNEYLAAENRILSCQLKGRPPLSDAERTKLGEIGHRLGRKALGEVAIAALPDTILSWYRRLVARKFDGSRARRTAGRPRIDREVEELIVRMAEENWSWGYDQIVGALANLGHEVSDQTVGNVLRRYGLPPASERNHTTTWAAFIRAHLAVLAGPTFSRWRSRSSRPLEGEAGSIPLLTASAPIIRSTYAFCQGEREAVTTSVIPIASP